MRHIFTMSIILGIIYAVQTKTTLGKAHLFSLLGGIDIRRTRHFLGHLIYLLLHIIQASVCLFGFSLPPVVCGRDRVLFMLFVFACVWWCQKWTIQTNWQHLEKMKKKHNTICVLHHCSANKYK
jgi:hypothetical protein